MELNKLMDQLKRDKLNKMLKYKIIKEDKSQREFNQQDRRNRKQYFKGMLELMKKQL